MLQLFLLQLLCFVAIWAKVIVHVLKVYLIFGEFLTYQLWQICY